MFACAMSLETCGKAPPKPSATPAPDTHSATPTGTPLRASPTPIPRESSCATLAARAGAASWTSAILRPVQVFLVQPPMLVIQVDGLPFDEQLLDLSLGFQRISIGKNQVRPLAFFD